MTPAQKRYASLRSYLNHLIYRSIGTTDLVRRIEWRIVLSWLDLKGQEKVLDVACGTGILDLKIAEMGCEVYGIDISEDSIKAANRFAQQEDVICQFKVSNAEAIPYHDDYFDKIYSNCSLEHFQDDVQALNEMRRVLKPNGLLVLTVDSLSYPGVKESDKARHRKEFAVVNYYTDKELRRKIETVGFEIIASKYYLNSFVSHIVYWWSMYLGWQKQPRYVVPMLSIIVFYPLCSLSDLLFGSDKWGYGLAVKARKSPSGNFRET